MAFAPDGRTLATAGGIGGADGTVLLWDLADPAKPRRLGKPLTDHATRCALGGVRPGRADPGHRRRQGDRVEDGTVLLWDLADRAKPRRLGEPLTGHSDAVISVAFAPDGQTLATAGARWERSCCGMWPIRTKPHVLVSPALTGQSELYLVAFAPDGQTLATATAPGTAHCAAVGRGRPGQVAPPR